MARVQVQRSLGPNNPLIRPLALESVLGLGSGTPPIVPEPDFVHFLVLGSQFPLFYRVVYGTVSMSQHENPISVGLGPSNLCFETTRVFLGKIPWP